MLCDKDSNTNLLHFARYNSHRVARSVLGAETYEFADAYDDVYCAKCDLEKVLDRRVPLMILTDSKSLFDIITKCSQTKERRLIIDLQSVRDVYACHEITNIGFIRGPKNPADDMIKIGHCAALEYLLQTGRASFKID